MKLRVSIPLLLLAVSAAGRGEIIDRIAVSVGSRVITESDLLREIRVVAFQNGVKPDLSPANKRATAEKMIAQKLIERDLENSRYPMPTGKELEPVLEEFKKTHYPDDAAYRKALAEYGITEKDLLDVLLWERTLLRFIQLRFESSVLVTDQEVAAYAQQHHESKAEAEKSLTSSRADQQLEQWLEDARRRTTIVMHPEALE